VLAAIRRMAVLQIDTISVVARSPYLVLFSRIGAFEPQWLDDLLADGRIFEYWAHEASCLPIEDYALVRHRMLAPEAMGWKYRPGWVGENGHELRRVLDWIRENGPARSADFERRDGAGGGWWEWKPEKRALEALFTAGELMVARRQGFQRVYDLRERVHPDWSDELLPEPEEARRRMVLNAVRALGVTQARWVSDYYRMERRETPDIVRSLAREGALLEARVAGWDEVAYVHPDHAGAADRAAEGGLAATHTTLLSPFDPLVWDRARALTIFGFDYRLECYTPAHRRRYGYFVLPLLRRGRLAGRLDAKAHRREGRFEVKSLHLEDGIRASDALLNDLVRALTEAAVWHGTPRVVINRTEPAALRTRLQRMLRSTLTP
jgi:uncharacterized protein